MALKDGGIPAAIPNTQFEESPDATAQQTAQAAQAASSAVDRAKAAVDEATAKTAEAVGQAQAQAQPDPSPSSAPPPAVQTGGAVGAVRKGLKDFIGALENQLPAVGFSGSPRLVGSQGCLMDEKKRSLGASITFRLLSWNAKWVVRVKEKTDEAKTLVRYADSPTVLSDGMPITTYMEQLKAKNYTPSLAEYVELVGLVESSEKPSEYTASGRLVVVSMSPTSRDRFAACRRDTTVSLMLGKIQETDQPLLKMVAEATSAKGNDWTAITTTFIDETKAAA